jgi:hypothetical protein
LAVNNVIVYFPWGAGGNFIKNVCNIDPRFDWFDEQEFRPDIPPAPMERYHFLYHYHSTQLQSDNWLWHEGLVRRKYTAKYHQGGKITYWDPEFNTVYEAHGEVDELDRILDPAPLLYYDRTRVDAGITKEQISYWKLEDCKHVFLLPKNIQLITDIYHSKNPILNQLNQNASLESRRKQAFIIIRLMTLRLQELADTLAARGATVYKYTADDLYSNTGNQLVEALVQDLGQRVPIEYIRPLHRVWLDSTRSVYQKFYNRDLP